MRCVRRVVVLTGTALLLGAPSSATQEIDSCYPLRVESASTLAGLLGLSETAQSALEKALRNRELRDPSDLYRLAGFDASQRDGLESLLCWGESSTRFARLTLRQRGHQKQVDSKVSMVQKRVGWVLRKRDEDYRGGLWLGSGAFDLALGTLRQQRGLGLAVGREQVSRNPFPRVRTKADRPTTGMHLPGELAGSLRWNHRAWQLHLGQRNREDADSRAFVALEQKRIGGTLGALVLRSRQTRGASFYGTHRFAATRVDGELARLGHGQAWRGQIQHQGTLWNLLVSLGWESSEFGWVESGLNGTPEWLSQWELRSKGSSSWRVSYRLNQDVEERSTRVEGELSEVFGPWRGSVLLRRDSAFDSDVLLRSDLRWLSTRWEWRFRYEEHLESSDAQLLTVDLRHRQAPRFRIRLANADREERGPTLWWYRRRAGGVYGWDSLHRGVWAGFWGEVNLGPATIEVSMDSYPGGADAVLALKLE